MPVFEYKALDPSGRSIAGLKEADSPKTLRAVLRRDGVYLTEVLGQREAAAAARRDVGQRLPGRRISAEDVAITTRQLAVLVGAGIPLVEALGALVDQVDHERMKRVVDTRREICAAPVHGRILLTTTRATSPTRTGGQSREN